MTCLPAFVLSGPATAHADDLRFERPRNAARRRHRARVARCRRAATTSGSTSQSPTEEEARILAEPFGFHELAIEDALKEIQTPEDRELRRLPLPDPARHRLLGGASTASRRTKSTSSSASSFLVTVHDEFSRSVAQHARRLPAQRLRAGRGAGGAAAPHRRRDGRQLPARGRQARGAPRRDRGRTSSTSPTQDDIREILGLKRDVASLRRVVTPQRDVVGRLARREFPQISEALSYRFRDVYDHLVRLADEANLFHDRVTSLLDAHLSFTSNRLNQVMKTLTVISTIFLPLTVLTGMFGMNVDAAAASRRRGRRSSGGSSAMMVAIGGLMLWFFNRSKYR